jgi:hypothetical protein
MAHDQPGLHGWHEFNSNFKEEIIMMRSLLFVLFFGLISSPLVGATSSGTAANISGTWSFSVDLESGQHSTPTFIFKHQGGNLTGTYKGQLGEHNVTGSVKGNKVAFGLAVTDPNSNQAIKITYSGTIESPTKMAGAIKASSGQQGKWTAAKK